MPEPATLLAFADASMAEAGGVFDWLADEPDLYSDADLVQPLPWRAG